MLAGFHAPHPDPAVPALLQAGEQWASAELRVADHDHPAWELYLQLDGASSWWVAGGADHDLRPGAALVVPPGTQHGMRRRPSARNHFLYAVLDVEAVLEAIGTAATTRWVPDVHRLDGARELELPFRLLIREVALRQAHRTQGLATALQLLVLQATRSLGGRGGAPLMASHPAVQRARALLEHDPSQPWRLADLGRAVGLSPNHLAECFTAEVGEPPHRYLTRCRVQRAKEALTGTDVPVSRLAAELGFSSPPHLARVFRAWTGYSPSAWRAQPGSSQGGGS